MFVDPKLVTDRSARRRSWPRSCTSAETSWSRSSVAHNRFDYLARKVPLDLADKIGGAPPSGVDLLDESTVVMPEGPTTRLAARIGRHRQQGSVGPRAQYDTLLTGQPGELTLAENPQGRTIPVGEHQLVAAVPGQRSGADGRPVDAVRDRADPQPSRSQSARAKGGIAIVSNALDGRDPRDGQRGGRPEDGPGDAEHEQRRAHHRVRARIGHEDRDDLCGARAGSDHADQQVRRARHLLRGRHDLLGRRGPRHRVDDRRPDRGPVVATSAPSRSHRRSAATASTTASAASATDPAPHCASRTRRPVRCCARRCGRGPRSRPCRSARASRQRSLQVLEAYNTIANGGRYVAPRLLDATIDPQGHTHPVPADQGHRVMSTKTADEMNLMLRGVVTGGTGTWPRSTATRCSARRARRASHSPTVGTRTRSVATTTTRRSSAWCRRRSPRCRSSS